MPPDFQEAFLYYFMGVAGGAGGGGTFPDFINRTPKITQTALESISARQFYPKASILSL